MQVEPVFQKIVYSLVYISPLRAVPGSGMGVSRNACVRPPMVPEPVIGPCSLIPWAVFNSQPVPEGIRSLRSRIGAVTSAKKACVALTNSLVAENPTTCPASLI